MPLRIALVGAGHMGRIHLSKLVEFEDVTVTAVAETSKEVALAVSERYNTQIQNDYHGVPDVDGVVIATPTETHLEIARWFLERGSHVFLEKPIATDVEEARILIDLARERKRTLQIGHLERFNPAFMKATSMIEKPFLIEAARLGPFTGRSTDVDIVLDLMIHDIDLVLSLVKSPVRELRAQGAPFYTDSTDAAGTRLEFEDGSIAVLEASRMSVQRERYMRVYERDRHFFIDLLTGKLTVMTRHSKGTIETSEYETGPSDAVRAELLEFVNSMKGTAAPTVTGEDGLLALELAGRISGYVSERTTSRF